MPEKPYTNNVQQRGTEHGPLTASMIFVKEFKNQKGNASCNRNFKKENIKFYWSLISL